MAEEPKGARARILEAAVTGCLCPWPADAARTRHLLYCPRSLDKAPAVRAAAVAVPRGETGELGVPEVIHELLREGLLRAWVNDGTYQVTPGPLARRAARDACLVGDAASTPLEVRWRAFITELAPDEAEWILDNARDLVRVSKTDPENVAAEAIDHYREGLYKILRGESDPVGTVALYLGEQPPTAREPQRLPGDAS